MLTDGWDLTKLLGDHASLPFNPDIANAFSVRVKSNLGGAASNGSLKPATKTAHPTPCSGFRVTTFGPNSPTRLNI